ncbi:MAG: hypothetical protein ACLSB9_30360 [Hydrogeniiclostridium mannosilyticum]
MGMTKSLTQTVYPAAAGVIPFGADRLGGFAEKYSRQVGIEVTFEYEDGSTETRFIDLF